MRLFSPGALGSLDSAWCTRSLSFGPCQYSAKDSEYVRDAIGSIWALPADLSDRDTVAWSEMHAYGMHTV